MARFPERLATDRLLLRRVTTRDAEDVFAYASDPEVARFMAFPTAKRREDVVGPFLERVQAPMASDVDDTKSAAVLRKIGMSEERRLRRWCVHPNVTSEPRDSLVFSIVR